MRIAFLTLLLAIAASTLSAQDAMTKLRLAQEFEDAGEWERSASFYSELHTIDRSNYIYYDGLLRSFVQLKRYEDAISLVDERMQFFPGDVMLRATAGGLYFDAGNNRAADSLWSSTLDLNPKNGGAYRVVANEQMNRRLMDRAIQTYLAGRTATQTPALFAEELSALYSAMQEYAKATEEYILLLQSNPQQLASIETRIASFTMRANGVSAARDVVTAHLKKQSNDISLRSLRAWLAMEARDYESAFNDYTEIDRLSKANGMELYRFAQRAISERVYSSAAKAFRLVIDQTTNNGIRPGARFGFARSVEELSATDSTVELSAPQSFSSDAREVRATSSYALRLYDSLTTEFQYGDIAVQSWFRIGVIKADRLFDLDGALEAFRKAKAIQPNSPMGYEAALRIAEVYTLKNDLPHARTELQTLANSTVQDLAAFRIAELDYFEGNFNGTLEKLKRFDGSPNNDVANDALTMRYFIQENKTTSPEALKEFAKADLLSRQKKYSEALALFQQIAAANPQALLLDDASLNIADLQLTLGRTDDALKTLAYVVDELTTGILRDAAQFRIGEIFEQRKHDPEHAIEAYEKLLTVYPNSLYAEETRKRIRHLRGER